MRKILPIAVILFLYASVTHAQKFYTGCLIEDSVYERMPQNAPLLTRDYTVLPERHSLEKYCPTPNNQGPYGTCVGWSTAYAARTIAEAVANKWSHREKIDQEAFSPLFVYLNIKGINDNNCQNGTAISNALNFLKNEGIAKYKDFNFKCASSVPLEIQNNIRQYKIDDYSALFGLMATPEEIIRKTKKALSEDKPVITTINCYDSFTTAKEVWTGITDKSMGAHAVCLTGYDDNKNGGSFQIMNSWGIDWGVDGFTWITYNDFSKHVRYAYEMFVRKKTVPYQHKPVINILKTVNLAGNIRFELSVGKEMQGTLYYPSNGLPYYKLSGDYISGTRYRIYISNNEPAYVYVIGSDLTNNVNKLFPPNRHISPALLYKSNDIAIPDEKLFMEMDNITGTDYICVLYSYEALPVDEIIEKIKNASGSFSDKVKTALADKMIPAKEIKYKQKTIRFSVKNTEKTVVPVIIEIKHI